MNAFIRLIERVTGSIGYLAALLIIPLILATCYEVFSRYLFGAPTIWAFELGYSMMGVHFLLGAALTLKMRGHIRIDLLYARFKERTKAAIDLLLYLFLLSPFLVLLTKALFEYTERAYQSGELTGQSAWNPPIWPFRALITLGLLLLGLQVLAEIIKCTRTLLAKRSPEDEEAR